jgi:hypothetical protein
MILFFALLTLAIGAMAATGESGTGIELGQYLTTLGGIAAAVTVVTQFVLKYVKTKYDQILSWVVSLIICAAGWILNLGIFQGIDWYWIIIYAVASGLAANGIFDIPVINALLNLIPKKKSVQ